jgi:UTP--glucose-1-phosphate uridylyltransferase
VVDCNGNNLNAGNTVEIKGMVEKPSVESAPSNLAIVGRYILAADIWPLLNNTDPGAGGEIQLTDAIGELLDTHSVEAYRIVGKSHDCGTKLGYMQAQVEYALRDDEIGERLRKSIYDIIDSV